MVAKRLRLVYTPARVSLSPSAQMKEDAMDRRVGFCATSTAALALPAMSRYALGFASERPKRVGLIGCGWYGKIRQCVCFCRVYWFRWVLLKTADVTAAHNFTLPAGSIVAVDRGYYDFDLFAQWNNSGVFFVTRLKSNAIYEVVKDCPPPQHSNVLTDKLIQFTGYQSRQKFPWLLRRVVVWDEDNHREIELLTNHLRFGATPSAESTRTAGKSSSSSRCSSNTLR